MRYWVRYMGFMLCMLLMLAACNTTRYVPEGRTLLKKNKISVDSRRIDKSEVELLVKPKANSRFLYVFGKAKLSVYSQFKDKKKNFLTRFLMNNWAEEPVLLDSLLMQNSERVVEQYLANIGYFDADVKAEVTTKKKKSVVTYNIKSGEPYIINSLDYIVDDADVREIIFADPSRFLIKIGSIYNVNTLKEERNRITNQLRNRGYYDFTNQYITFQIDSTLGNHHIYVRLHVSNPEKGGVSDTVAETIPAKHVKYRYDHIYIYPDFNPYLSDTVAYDTVRVDKYNYAMHRNETYYLLHREKLRFRPKTIPRLLSLRPGGLYRTNAVQNTYASLSASQNFGYSKIGFIPLPADTGEVGMMSRYLDVRILLSKAQQHSFSVEGIGKVNSDEYGIGANLSYENRNVFGGAEILRTKLNFSLESLEEESHSSLFNMMEIGAVVSLDVPLFVFPFGERVLRNANARPRTVFDVGATYQERVDYKRYTSTFGLQYTWQSRLWATRTIFSHTLAPIDLVAVKVNADEDFEQEIARMNRWRREQYTDHLILGPRYGFILNNQRKGSVLRFNVETAGNLLNLLVSSENKNANGQKLLFDIPYANYIRADFDYRYYQNYRKQTTAYRLMFGLGVPLKNSHALPFERGFFAGGGTSMRAWSARSLGPGGDASPYSRTNMKTGDIKAEVDLEHRFPIYKMINGALFAEAGNIWLFNKNASIENGEFSLDRFYKEIAVDAGFGLRLLFLDNFVVRFDIATKLYDPAEPESSRWIRSFGWSSLNLNFGIGYPF